MPNQEKAPFSRLASHLSRLALTLTLVLAVSMPAQAAMAAYSDIFVFGDSLSETGNYEAAGAGALAYPPPYASGRFSNGPVWVEHLAGSLGLAVSPSFGGGNNYAWGGARTGGQPGPLAPLDLGVQTGLFLNDVAGVADPDALYVVWGGGNDALANDVTNSASNLENVINGLAASGARNFLVPNLPEIGAPFVQLNAAVGTMLDGVEASNPLLNLMRLDVNGLFATFIGDALGNGGALFGFTNVFDPCYDGNTVCADPDSYLLWDEVHPTAAAHAYIGAAAFAEVSAVPLPAAAWMLVPAVGVLAGRRRRAS